MYENHCIGFSIPEWFRVFFFCSIWEDFSFSMLDMNILTAQSLVIIVFLIFLIYILMFILSKKREKYSLWFWITKPLCDQVCVCMHVSIHRHAGQYNFLLSSHYVRSFATSGASWCHFCCICDEFWGLVPLHWSSCWKWTRPTWVIHVRQTSSVFGRGGILAKVCY